MPLPFFLPRSRQQHRPSVSQCPPAVEPLEARICLSDVTTTAFATNTAEGTQQIASADFNGDGHADLAGVLPFQDVVGVFLNAGAGAFARPTFYHLGSPRALAVGDFNGDGHPDLAVAGTFRNRDTIDLLLNNGDGTFTLGPTRFPVRMGGFSMIAGDFNNDGRTDLALTALGSVAVFLNDGAGTFTPAVYYRFGGTHPTGLMAADFNNDGVLDLVVARGQKDAVTVLLGNPAVPGTFGAPTAFPAGLNPDGVVTGDFNADGKTDLAVVNAGFRIAGLSVLLGNGDGTFRPRGAYAGTGDFSNSIAATDFNGDGKTDLLVGSFTTSLKVFLGNGDGTFAPPLIVPGGQHALHILSADFNTDSRPDVAVTPGRGIRIVLNGAVAPPPPVTSPTDIAIGGGNPSSTRFISPNGTQVTVTLRGPGTATVHLAGGPASFRLDSITATGTTAASTLSIVTHVGSRTVDLGSLTTDGSFGAISAPTTNLTGAMNVAGTVGRVSLLSANGGSITTAGGGAPLSLLLGQTNAENITSSQPIDVLRVDLGAAVNLTAPSIGRFTVGKSLHDSQVALTGSFAPGVLDLGLLSAATGIANTVIRSAGDVGVISAGGILNSSVYAGVGPLPPGQSLPVSAADFVAPAAIGSVRLTRPAPGPSFANSVIAAQTLGSISLGTIQTTNSGVPFGLAAHQITALAGVDLTDRKSFRLTNLTDAAALAATLAARGLDFRDFQIRLL